MPSLVLSSFLSAQHRALDQLMEATENACGTPRGLSAFMCFQEAMEHHLDLEEQFLFPLLAERMGPGGPLTVMRQEHDSIRALLRAAPNGHDAAAKGVCRALFETLTVLVSQHHLKEENVLYPMSDSCLADCAESLLQSLLEAMAVHA